MKIGILNIQGSVKEHLACLKKLSVDVVLVKKPADLEGLGGLIIPGGESTTLEKLLKEFGLRELILKHAKEDMAIWGTCAGAILLAKKGSLELMNISVERNAYGGQLESFEVEVKFGENDSQKIPAVFIRAPRIGHLGKSVEVLAQHNDDAVAVRDGRFLATTFHPELTKDLRVHRYFLEMCKKH